MNNLASLFASPPTNSTSQARLWALKALSITEAARAEEEKRANKPVEECEHVLAAILFNLGMLHEVSVPYFPK